MKKSGVVIGILLVSFILFSLSVSFVSASLFGDVWNWITGNDSPTYPIGTIQNPIQIRNCGELQNISKNLTAYYALANDIDCSETRGWNKYMGDCSSLSSTQCSSQNGCYWYTATSQPICSASYGFKPIQSFAGSLDGNKKKINNLYINRPKESNVGLFGSTSSGTIKDIALFNVNISGYSNVGGLIGSAGVPQNISRVAVTGEIYGLASFAGIVGLNLPNGQIKLNMYNTYFIGKIKIYPGFSNQILGGLVSATSRAVIINSYSVTEQSSSNQAVCSIGSSTSSITGVYYNLETCLSPAGNPSSVGKTTAQMKNISTYVGWDFTTTWDINTSINNGYPYLRSMA